MWGTPHGSRRTVTGCSRPVSFRVPLVKERADWARCSRDGWLPADCGREAARLFITERIAGYARLAATKTPITRFQEGRAFIVAESPLIFPGTPAIVRPSN